MTINDRGYPATALGGSDEAGIIPRGFSVSDLERECIVPFERGALDCQPRFAFEKMKAFQSSGSSRVEYDCAMKSFQILQEKGRKKKK